MATRHVFLVCALVLSLGPIDDFFKLRTVARPYHSKEFYPSDSRFSGLIKRLTMALACRDRFCFAAGCFNIGLEKNLL